MDLDFTKFELPPRLVDWTILLLVGFAFTTGLVSFVSGAVGDRWVFVAHGVGGLALPLLLFWKFRRVRYRVTKARWTRTTVVSVALAVVVLVTLGTGVAWALGANARVWLWTFLSVHVFFGLVTVALVTVHLAARFRPPSREDLEGRRTALQYAGVAAVGVGLWSVQRIANVALDTAGADRRFTGSKESGSFAGNAYPVTAWVADDPDPVDVDDWSLSVDGAVADSAELDYDAVADFDDELTATLDCTSGWYTEQDWTGVRLGRLLDKTGVDDDAAYVSVRSVTGYRWTFPITEAREAMLATGASGDRLDHGHGFPLRLVAPGRRGFQWVKWVETVEVRRDPDPGQWAAVFVSGFTDD